MRPLAFGCSGILANGFGPGTKTKYPGWRRSGAAQYAAKLAGRGFDSNPVDVLVRGDNPAALKTRDVPVHAYKVPSGGADGGSARVEQQNRLVAKRK